ncbi:MAG: hypothetical protein ACI9KE_003634, partial [Polyangiales bacterium]
ADAGCILCGCQGSETRYDGLKLFFRRLWR